MSQQFALSKLPADLKTPCYVFDPAVVEARIARLREALGGGVVVSLKANPLLDLFVRCAHAFTDGVEVASQGELNLVVGRLAAPRFVNTPAMDADLMAAAHASRSTIVLDSPHHVAAYIARFGDAHDRARLMLRANVGSLIGGKLGTRHGDQFGMDPATLVGAAQTLTQAGCSLSGVAMFGGSNSFADLAMPIAENAGHLIAQVEGAINAKLSILNLGGGLAADWETTDLPLAAYRSAISRLPAHLTVLHDAGRALFGAAGVFAVRLVSVKSIDQRQIGVCDGGIAHCFALGQTESFIKRARRGEMLQPVAANDSAEPIAIELFGNSCSRADRIGEVRCGELPVPGDVIVFGQCGAYHTYSPTGFLNLKPAMQYVVS